MNTSTLPAIIRTLITMSVVSTLEDGTVEHTMNSRRMYASQINAIRKLDTNCRDMGKGLVYNGSGADYSWSAQIVKGVVKFSFADYTIPMKAESGI